MSRNWRNTASRVILVDFQYIHIEALISSSSSLHYPVLASLTIWLWSHSTWRTSARALCFPWLSRTIPLLVIPSPHVNTVYNKDNKYNYPVLNSWLRQPQPETPHFSPSALGVADLRGTINSQDFSPTFSPHCFLSPVDVLMKVYLTTYLSHYTSWNYFHPWACLLLSDRPPLHTLLRLLARQLGSSTTRALDVLIVFRLDWEYICV